MACATLKRPLEFDPLHSPNPTKRRCMPMSISPSNSPPRNLSSPPRPSTSSSGTMTMNDFTPFVSHMSKLTSDAIANNIYEEMKRLHKRKELYIPQSLSTSPFTTQQQQQSSSSSSAQQQHQDTTNQQHNPSTSSSTNINNNNNSTDDDKDKPIFTFRQVEYICYKMLNEQENKLREEYNTILNYKLKEQFDIFNTFSIDQIDRLAKHNHNHQTASYLS